MLLWVGIDRMALWVVVRETANLKALSWLWNFLRLTSLEVEVWRRVWLRLWRVAAIVS